MQERSGIGKRARNAKYPELEEALYIWIME